jgi:alpha-L-rhamnosidase
VAAWATQRREAVRAGFDAFWDEQRGVYIDHIVDGVAQPEAAQHGGASALAAGLVPADRVPTVVAGITDRSRLIQHAWYMDTVTVEGQSSGAIYMAIGYPEPDWDTENEMVEAEPFFRYVVHDGLARAGRADLIAELCRDWNRFVDAGETSWPECWGGGTRCHGWSSTPTRDLIVHTLGITPAEPGYDSVRVAPALGGIDWARATVPTPHGPITVEARADGTVDIDSPVPVV